MITTSMEKTSIPCLICGNGLELRPARGRKSGKAFLMLICPENGRHFRAFVTDQEYVAAVLAKLESQQGIADSLTKD